MKPLTPHDALCLLAPLIRAARPRSIWNAATAAEYQRITALYDDTCQMDSFPTDFDDLPLNQRLRIEIDVAAAAVEFGSGAICRALKAARLTTDGSGAYKVCSESQPGRLHRVRLLFDGKDACSCNANSTYGCFHRTAARHNHDLRTTLAALLADDISPDTLDQHDPLTHDDRPLPSPRSLRELRSFREAKPARPGSGLNVRPGWAQKSTVTAEQVFEMFDD